MTDPIGLDLKPMFGDGVATVAVSGELDCSTAPRLSEVLASVAVPGRVILVDLRATEFMDCAGVAVLVAAHRCQRQLGGDLILDLPRGEVSRIIELTQLDTFITVVGRKDPERARV